MQQHTNHAFEMLSPISYLQPALDIPYCHHERWDGSHFDPVVVEKFLEMEWCRSNGP